MGQIYDLSQFVDQRLLRPYATLVCGDESYTLGEAMAVMPALKDQWAADLLAQGVKTTADAIEGYWSVPGAVREDGHEGHGHIALKCWAVPVSEITSDG